MRSLERGEWTGTRTMISVTDELRCEQMRVEHMTRSCGARTAMFILNKFLDELEDGDTTTLQHHYVDYRTRPIMES